MEGSSRYTTKGSPTSAMATLSRRFMPPLQGMGARTPGHERACNTAQPAQRMLSPVATHQLASHGSQSHSTKCIVHRTAQGVPGKPLDARVEEQVL